MATNQEMKNEALRRMRAIGLYDGTIDAFDKENEVHVYEPPHGCSYCLEDEDIENVKNFEESNNCIVWGVIRTFFSLSGHDFIGDSFLFVSSDSSTWKEEEKQLYEGRPTVYTIIQGAPSLSQMGTMMIYMSEGGTPLQDYPERIK